MIAAVLAVNLALLGGCGGLTTKQKDAVIALGKASAALGTTAETQMQEMREAQIEMNLQRLALTGYVKPTPKQLKALNGQPDPNAIASLDAGFELSSIKRITNGTKALVRYGTVLVALVNDTQSEKLITAAAGFASSLQSAGVTADASQISAIGTVTEGISGLVVQEKRKQAVLKFVLGSQDNVATIAEYIANKFEGSDVTTGFFTVRRVASETATASFLDAKSYQSRRDAQTLMKLALENDEARAQALAGVAAAARKIRKANDALVVALNDPSRSIDEILEFAQQVQALQQAVKDTLQPGAANDATGS